MTWQKATYRCSWGHKHVITVKTVPPHLEQRHGIREGGPPRCAALLNLVKTEPIAE